jgi:very-short-patch-repair endonuclease
MRNNERMPEEMKRRVQELRREATEAEKVLWRLLRGRRFMHVKFRRQHGVQG